MSKASRGTSVFRVNTPDGGSVLVEAVTERSAISHVVGKFFTASRLSASELIDAARNGHNIESAVAKDEPAAAGGEAQS